MMKIFSVGIGSLLLLLPHSAYPTQQQEKKLPRIVMASISPSAASPLGHLSKAIYTEAFQRVGYDLVVIYLPPARASMAADAGMIDGELGRGPTYGVVHPALVRVDESAFTMTLSAYTTEPGVELPGWKALRDKSYKVEYRLGIEVSRSGAMNVVPAASLSSVPSTLQGLRKLAIGRTDVFIDFEEHVDPLLTQRCFVNSERIVRSGIMQQVQIHAYMSRKNLALAARLSAALRAMKHEGVIAAYQRRASEHPAPCGMPDQAAWPRE
jgi:hypothetical protein